MSAHNVAVQHKVPTAIYVSLAAGFFMAALTALNFALPLRALEVGATKGEVGLLLGLLVFTAGFVALAGGALGDYIGRRRTILAAIAISALAQLALALSTSLAPMYGLQVAGGIGLGATQATLFAAAADSAAPGRLGRAMGTLLLGLQVGMLSGPAGAGLALGRFNSQEVIALAATLYVVAFVLVLVGVPRGTTRQRFREVLENMRAIGRQWAFLTASVATFAWSFMWPAVLGFAPLIGKEFLHLPVQQVGLLVAGLGAVSALFAVPAGRIVDGIVDKQALLVGTTVVAACLVIAFGNTSGLPAGILILTVAALVSSVTGISVGLSHFELASAQARGMAMGLLLTTTNLASGIGAPVFGFLLQRFGYSWGLNILGACAIGLTLLAVLLRYVRHLNVRPGESDGRH